jgi:hypothetical protein
MKVISLKLLIPGLLCTLIKTCDAYTGILTGSHQQRQRINRAFSSTTCLSVVAHSRRNWIAIACSSAAVQSLLQQATATENVVDYSKIQDLLGPGGGDYVSPYQTPDGKRPTWLTEPTEEFKESEQKAMEFKRNNLIISKKFQSLLDIIAAAPNNEVILLDTLDSLRRLVKSNGGLPIGITKDEIIKTCRRRKSKKFWPTQVEVAYV